MHVEFEDRRFSLTVLNWSDWPVRCAHTDRQTEPHRTHYLRHSLRSLGGDNKYALRTRTAKISRVNKSASNQLTECEQVNQQWNLWNPVALPKYTNFHDYVSGLPSTELKNCRHLSYSVAGQASLFTRALLLVPARRTKSDLTMSRSCWLRQRSRRLMRADNVRQMKYRAMLLARLITSRLVS